MRSINFSLPYVFSHILLEFPHLPLLDFLERERKYYQEACKYLAKMRALYEKLGETEAWMSYITDLREKNRNLRALKEELANVGL